MAGQLGDSLTIQATVNGTEVKKKEEEGTNQIHAAN